jgi:GNAT superfamily N-acetyltransferase
MMDLRRASTDDRARLEAFQKSAYARTEAAVGARAIPLEWDYGEILENCEVWFDESGGSLIGVLIFRVLETELFLESIATAPDSAGTGRGRLLFEATFERARKLGLKRIGLITNSLNPALAWYKRMGFLVELEDVQPDRRVIHMSAVVPKA